MNVFIASDHGGYFLKEFIKEELKIRGYEVTDMGNKVYDTTDDYPDFVIPCAQKVAENYGSMGVIIGKSGNGEAIAVNKVKGVRAALCLNESMGKRARQDNDANILALGAEFVSKEQAEKILEVFFDTPFPEEERHIRRIGKITDFEISNMK